DGIIGYVLEQELANVALEREVVSVHTRVRVDARDQVFSPPTKPIDPLYDEETAIAVVASHD
ncbi:MAG: carbamate kinase, partial [Actinomycetota bacterium]|nr:carbamate kinase [Actinomycetota bacterium]